ncbi:MAG: hypothetical protein IME94_10700 [Proteobacteria bacterium]|nr:hypothetical protein [Pseudomonadota bacterium]
MTDKLKQCLNIARAARIRYHLRQLNPFMVIFVALKPNPKLPDSILFFDFWYECGLESSYGDAARLEVLNKWLAVLYSGQSFDVASRLAQLHEGRAAHRARICVRYVYGALDDVVERLGQYLPG